MDVLIEAVIERDANAPDNEGADEREQDGHRRCEADDEPKADWEAAESAHAGSRWSWKPTPRTVFREFRWNGRSILARRLAMWTSIALLRRSVSPSQTASKISNRVTTRPARSASSAGRANSRVVSSIATPFRVTCLRSWSMTRSSTRICP